MIAILCVQYDRITTSQHVWIMIGSGKHERRHNLGQVYAALGPKKCVAMPIFHLLTGCDSTSAIRSKGKRLCMSTRSNEWLSDTLCDLSYNPFSEVNEQSETFQRLQTFIANLYAKNSSDVNAERKRIFGH